MCDWTLDEAREIAGGRAVTMETAAALEHMAAIADVPYVRVVRKLDGTAVVAHAGGEATIDLTGTLEPLTEWFDELLAEAGRPERRHTLPRDDDFEVFVLRDSARIQQTEVDLPLLKTQGPPA